MEIMDWFYVSIQRGDIFIGINAKIFNVEERLKGDRWNNILKEVDWLDECPIGNIYYETV